LKKKRNKRYVLGLSNTVNNHVDGLINHYDNETDDG